MNSEHLQKIKEREDYCRKNNIIPSFDSQYKSLMDEVIKEGFETAAKETEEIMRKAEMKAKKSFVMTKHNKEFYKTALESIVAIRSKVKGISQEQALRDMEKEMDEIIKKENSQQKKMEDELIKQRNKLANVNVGIDPETMQAGITLAGYHIEAGSRKFTAFAQAMINDMGDAIKPYLKSFYNAVRDWPGFNAGGMDDYVTVSGTNIDELMVSKPTEEEGREAKAKEAT